MNETPFYFTNKQYSLFGMLHEPEGGRSLLPAFVFCHPFAEEKLWAHRVLVVFARQLAAKGHPVLRFDYMGNGDSDGEFSGSSLITIKDDVHRAIDEVRRRTGIRQVNLLGLRLGATVASLVAEDGADIDRLILWAPVVDGDRYMQELLRVNLTTQLATYKTIRHDRAELVAAMQQGRIVNVDGYEMAYPLFSQLSAVKLAADRKRHQRPCLIVQIDRQPGNRSAEFQRLAACYERATLTIAQEEPFWKEIARSYQAGASQLFAVTSDWLSAQSTI